MRKTYGWVGLGLALAARAARAGTVVSGTYLGADGQPGNASTSTDGSGQTYNAGDYGRDGYDPPAVDTYTFTPTAQATGGKGADIVGTDGTVIYQGGSGGTGVSTSTAGIALTVNGGRYTGGNGGDATGTGYGLLGGSGGNGLYVGGDATAVVNAGTFTGGNRGLAMGTQTAGAPFSFVGGSGGAVEGSAAVTITGGTFSGGGGQDTGSSGSGLIVFGGTADLRGGTFNAGGPALADDNNDFDKGLFLFGGTTTLYGTNFTIDGAAVSSGTVTTAIGTLAGVLQDNGGPTSITFDNDGGTLVLVDLAAAPEPTSLALFTIAAGGLLIRRRRRRLPPGR